MNWLDFIVFGPISIWFLGVVVLFQAIVWMTTNNRMIAELKQTTSTIMAELEKITSELSRDISDLRDSTTELNVELQMTRKSSEDFHKTLQRLQSFWFPYGNSQ